MKKLYTVTVETELVVLADSPEDAEYNAEHWAREGDFDVFAKEMTYLPNGWEPEALPYGKFDDDTPEKTIEQLIEEGCAPEYIKTKERLEIARSKLKEAKARAEEKGVIRKFTAKNQK